MRSLVRHGLVIGTCLGALLTGAGCEQKKATEYITGVSTQVTVPKFLKSVRIQIATQGFVQFCANYQVYNGKVLLPRSLGNFPISSDSNRSSVTFSIVGLTEPYEAGNANNPIFNDCQSAAQVNANNVRILRRSTQPYVPDKILFLPMALKYSCFDKTCGEAETCKGGVCVSDATDPSKLSDYVEGMGDGADGACFSTGLCMGASIPAVPVNPDTCEFALAESADAKAIKELPLDQNPFRPACTTANQATVCGERPCAADGHCQFLPDGAPPWTGLNVEVSYDGAQTTEILDLDPEEGYSIPDPAKPQTFRLAPGLCDMLKGTKGPDGKRLAAHRITSVRASGTCAAKTPAQGICIEDQLKIMGADKDGNAGNVDGVACKSQSLTPSKSALVLVVDKTAGHASFFGRDVAGELEAPLRDPAFERTDIGLMLADSGTTCPAPAPTLKPALPGGVSDVLGPLLDTNTVATTDLGSPNIEAQLLAAYQTLGALDDSYARRGVVILGNRDLDTSTCGGAEIPSTLAAEQLAKPSKPIATFAAKVTSAGDPLAAQLIADRGSPHDANNLIPYQFNAVSAQDKKGALQAVINYLATCLYDVPVNELNQPTPPADDAVLNYADPLVAQEKTIPHVAACAGDTPGWTIDSSDGQPRVRICGSACTDYQRVLAQTSSFTVLYGQPSIAVPLFANTAACYPK